MNDLDRRWPGTIVMLVALICGGLMHTVILEIGLIDTPLNIVAYSHRQGSSVEQLLSGSHLIEGQRESLPSCNFQVTALKRGMLNILVALRSWR